MPCKSRTTMTSRRSFAQLLALTCASCKRVGHSPQRFTGLQSELSEITTSGDFWGTVLVTQGSRRIFCAARGYSDAGQTPLQLDDRFVIGSLSKQVTAALVLREYENRRLRLQDPIRKFLPEISQPWAGTVTIHHLLVHTHGIYDVKKPTRFEVGARFEYSQLGYHLLAKILEQVQKRTFAEICAELFASLRLRATFHPDRVGRAQIVQGFEATEGAEYRSSSDHLKNYAAAGSLISSASDLTKWSELLQAGKIVDDATLQLMIKRYATREHPIFREVEYGYGLLFKRDEQELQVGALGYAPGFASASYYYPKQNMNLVVLSNRVNLSKGFENAFRVHLAAMEAVKRASLGAVPV